VEKIHTIELADRQASFCESKNQLEGFLSLVCEAIFIES
jgi:hypothetical protein